MEDRFHAPAVHGRGGKGRKAPPAVKRMLRRAGGALHTASPYLYIAPLAATLLVFTVIPFFMSLALSFTRYDILTPPVFNGLFNYKKLLGDVMLRDAVRNTLLYALMVVPVQTVLSLLLASCVVRKGNSVPARFAKVAFFIPFLTASSIIGIVWKALLNGDIAAVEQFFALFGLKASTLLGDSRTALPTLAGIAVWKDLGYYMIIYVAGLLDIPQMYYEAARVDGASRFKEFWKITLPLVKPTTILIVFLGVTGSFKVFDLLYNLTGGGPGTSTMTIVMHAYNLNFKSNNAGYAMAVSNVLLFIVAVLSILQRKFVSKEKSEL